MRPACILTIALGLSFPAAPAHTQTPAAGQKAQDGATEEKTDAASTRESSATGTSAGATSSSTTAKRSQRAAPPDGAPRKIVVRKGGAKEPAAQIAPGMAPAEAARQRQIAEQWLASAGDELKLLAARALNAQQQETAGQIRNYMEGARSALQEGDLRRASTLAEKAHLLAEDLTQH